MIVREPKFDTQLRWVKNIKVDSVKIMFCDYSYYYYNFVIVLKLIRIEINYVPMYDSNAFKLFDLYVLNLKRNSNFFFIGKLTLKAYFDVNEVDVISIL